MNSAYNTLNLFIIITYLLFTDVVSSAQVVNETLFELTENFDNNIYLNNLNKKSDYITSITSQFIIKSVNRDIESGVKLMIGGEKFLVNQKLNNINWNGNLLLNINRLWFLPMDIKFNNDFALLPSGSKGQSNESSGSILVNRNKSFSNRLSLVLEKNQSQNLITSIAYSNNLTKYQDKNLIDNMTHSVNLGNNYSITQNDQIGIDYGYNKYIFSNSNRNDINTINMHYSKRLTPNLSTGINGGIIFLHNRKNNYSLGLNANKRFKNEDMTIGYSRNISTNEGLTSDISINQSLSIMIREYFSERFTAGLTGIYSTDRARSNSIDIQSRRFSLDGRYLFMSWLSGGITYSYNKQMNNRLSGVNVDRMQIGASLTSNF